MLLRHHRARIGTLRFTVLRRGSRLRAVVNSIGCCGVGSVSGVNNGGFTGSRRFPFVFFLFAVPWCHAASILFGSSGARARCAWHLLWRAHSIPSGAGSASAVTHHRSAGGSQLHLGRVRTRSTRSSAWLRAGERFSAHIPLHTSRLSTRARAHAYSLLWLARRSHGSCSLWVAVLGRRALLSPCDRTPMHFIYSGGSLTLCRCSEFG